MVVAAFLGVALALGQPTFTVEDLEDPQSLAERADAAIQRGDAPGAVSLLRREILQLPRTSDRDEARHGAVLRLGFAMVAAHQQTSDRRFLLDAKRVLERYRATHELLFGSTTTALAQRTEVDNLLALVERTIASPAKRPQVTAWQGAYVQQRGLVRPLVPTYSLYDRAHVRAQARPAVVAMRPALRSCWLRAFLRSRVERVDTTLELELAPDGTLTSASIVGKPLVDEDGNRCVAEAADDLQVAGKPTPEGLRVRVPLAFRWWTFTEVAAITSPRYVAQRRGTTVVRHAHPIPGTRGRYYY